MMGGKETWASVVFQINGDGNPDAAGQGFLQTAWSLVQVRRPGEPELLTSCCQLEVGRPRVNEVGPVSQPGKLCRPHL